MNDLDNIPTSSKIIIGIIIIGVIYLLMNFVFIGPSGHNPDDIGCTTPADCY